MNALLQPGPNHRPMTVADLDAVLAIETVSYSFPWTRGNFIDSLAAGYRCELRLAPEGDIAAYAVAMPGVDEMHLLNITVNPALWGQGHAQALMQRLIAHSRHLGHHALWLEVRPSNLRAYALYERLGFQTVGLRRGYYPDGPGKREDALVMSLPNPGRVPLHGLD